MPEKDNAPIPKGVAVYDRPAGPRWRPALVIPIFLGAATAVAAALHHFHYF